MEKKKSKLKILFLDIETSPNVAHVWGLWEQNISISQLLDSSYVMCWSAKWYDEDEVMFDSFVKSSHKKMIERIHKLVQKADCVVHFNGRRFDMPTLNKEFLKHGLTPPAPYIQVDLYPVVQQQFRFPSNKLEYVARALGLGGKVRHAGHQLWVDCMARKPAAWKRMEIYNKRDAILTQRLFNKLRPWIRHLPNIALHEDSDDLVCPGCKGSVKLDGFYYTKTNKYPRYFCKKCGAWSRSRTSIKSKRKNILVLI